VETIAVCDTEPIAIAGLRSLLEPGSGLCVVAAETSLRNVNGVVERSQPSVLILEKAFGIQPVLDVLWELRRAQSPTVTVVWSATFSSAEAMRLIQAGAGGVVRKTAPLSVLLHCVRSVLSGNTWMDEDMICSNRRADGDGALRSPLTARELQVTELVERGLKNKDIADTLGIRTGTVKIHLKHIFEKTGIRGRYGLALSGMKEKGFPARIEPEEAVHALEN
jgi:DNA-binding NarL/FixJ family response regulator